MPRCAWDVPHRDLAGRRPECGSRGTTSGQRMLQNLTLEQAPPISVPFRFFTVAPLFGVAAALLVIYHGPEIFDSRWTPAALGLTHLLTLGFMGFVMCGAMMQMLPVLGGAVVPRVIAVGSTVHVALLLGTISLSAGFLASSPPLMTLAGVLLAAGFGVFITALLVVLTRKPAANRTISAMRYALYALGATVVLGLVLLAVLAGLNPGVDPVLLTNIHLGWGVLGWIGLLVCGVGYQVVPMFQMTPRYPEWLTRRLVPVLFSGLLAWSVIALFAGHEGIWSNLWTLIFVVGYGAFALVTVHLQIQRRRKTEDVTRNFWTLGMVSILAAAALWTGAVFLEGTLVMSNFPFLLGILLIPGFAISVANGMLYRIVPFLIWFHLQHCHIATAPAIEFSVPNVKKIIPTVWMRWQFRFHLAALLLLLAASITPDLFLYPAGAVLLISFTLLSRNLIASMMYFRQLSLLLEDRIRAAA